MNTGGDAAEQIVRMSLEGFEVAVKITGAGAKNIAVLLYSILKEEQKTKGKARLTNLLRSGKPLKIYTLKNDDLRKFAQEAKKYGVLFTAVKDNTNNTGLCDIIAKQEDVTKLNYIMEKMGYAAPEKEIEPEPELEKEQNVPAKDEALKKNNPQVKENQQEKGFMKHEDTERTENHYNGKPSVRKKVEEIKAEQSKQKAEKTPQKEKVQTNTQPRKKKFKKKGKSR